MTKHQELITNRCFNEIDIGDSASIKRRLTQKDIQLFAIMSGDVNPAHMDEDYAKDSMFHEVIAHGLWGGSLISTVLGTVLPGPGTIYLGQSLNFKRPVVLGDVLSVEVTAKSKNPKNNQVDFDCLCMNQDDEVVIEGEAKVIAPIEKIERPVVRLPNVRLAERGRLRELFDAAEPLDPVPTAVVHPCNEYALRGAVEAAEANLILPYLVGPSEKILSVAEECKLDLKDYPIINVEHSHEAAEKAVMLAREGKVETLMKGSLHTDELMRAVLHKEKGIRSERRISHVFAFDVPTYPRPLLVTDAAINISPTLEEMRDIVQNAIDLAHALMIKNPKVAILSAVETVTKDIDSTLMAAALCKMADRGQITGGILDGPLAFDNAVSSAAAKAKSIVSPVAGQADILVAPDLEAGNILAKQLTHLADAQGSGIVMGARLPIILTSRADTAMERMASCSLAILYAHQQKKLVV
ncbi:MAG: bifunctional enoyl-CoA hydratase/phosphate acetyltransferase [Proteobacteria bacterium]|nr:bifunctional enoyl-CoA hydratase/phosphate acetyltransferase [Pseudomonadota bacterium]NOG61472.1 bifunctional enoyl-CoA hydratase/phosphate acetyltransferase [Pseudomonadota bacterium]